MGNKVYRVYCRTPDGSVQFRADDLCDGDTAKYRCRALRRYFGLHAWFRRESPPHPGRLSSFLARWRLRRLDE